MKFRMALAILATTATSLCGQELGLQQYLRRLKTAPGISTEAKVRHLSDTGVTLSDQGMRDLARAASTTGTSRARRSQNQFFTGGWNRKSRNTESKSAYSNQLGGSTYHSFDNGVSGTSNRVGSFRYHNYSNGVSGSSNDVGSFTYHNFNTGLNGSSSRVGNFTYHNFNNGLSGTSNNVGDFMYHNLSDGTNCTTSKVGSFAYTNCSK